MIKAVIVDDEKSARDILARLIEEISTEIEIQIIGFASSVQEGFKIINELKPDVVFLDIEMLDGTGFNLLEKFDEISFQVIFTTAYDQFAIKAFKYSAIDYLLKPINIDELELAIKKVSKTHKGSGVTDKAFLENLLLNINQLSTTKRIAINGANIIDYAYVSDILYCTSSLSATELYLQDGRKITSIKSLKEYEDMLNDCDFFRVSRTHLISLKHIKTYKKDKSEVIMVNNETIEVSRRKKKEFTDAMDVLH